MPKIVANEKAFSIERLQSPKGFTLIELLIVVIIISVLALFTFVSFTQVQKNARDGQRKGDLQAVAGVLQRFYSDNSKYPSSGSGLINVNATCATEPGTNVAWGTGGIVCVNAAGKNSSYIKALPAEPRTNPPYCYVRTLGNQSYELYANLETNTGNSYTCNGANYNYRVTPND